MSTVHKKLFRGPTNNIFNTVVQLCGQHLQRLTSLSTFRSPQNKQRLKIIAQNKSLPPQCHDKTTYTEDRYGR